MSYSREELRKLRNEIPIDLVIAKVLEIPAKSSEGYFRFLCPLCREFNTATNPRTNLGRCFRCERNFNLIDLLILVRGYSFRQAVAYLRTLHSQTRCSPA
jgi:hypothetical protein